MIAPLLSSEKPANRASRLRNTRQRLRPADEALRPGPLEQGCPRKVRRHTPRVCQQFAIGDHVLHIPAGKEQTSRGVGVIEDNWNSWCVCRECLETMSPAKHGPCEFCQDYAIFQPIGTAAYRCEKCLGISYERPIYSYCPGRCRQFRIVLGVSGKGVYEVRFGVEVVPVHQVWLKKVKI